MRRFSISCNRTLVLDGLHYARQVPLFPVERSFELNALAQLRSNAPLRISWPVLFLKAYAMVARDLSPLRRAYVVWPWPHFLEFPSSVAMLAIHREFCEEDRLCWGRFDAPETSSLVVLQRRLDQYQQQPVEVAFERQVRFSRWPMLLRSLVWWWNLNIAATRRAPRLGTFSLSSLAGQGALNRGHPTFLTSSLSYGPIDADGRMLVTLLCDHRVLDGKLAALALTRLEQVLTTDIAQELAILGKVAHAA